MARTASLLLAAAVLFTAACGDAPRQAGPVAPDPAFDRVPDASSPGVVRSNVNLLFPPSSPLRDDVRRDVEEIHDLLRAGQTAATQAALDLIGFLLDAYDGGGMAEPAGPSTAEEALAALVDGLLVWVGFGALDVNPGILDGSVDGAIAVVGPTGGTVVTPNGHAGVAISDAAIDGTIVVAIERLDVDPCLLLPAGVPQFEGCFDFSMSPEITFATEVEVGVCLDAAGLPLWDELRLHSFDPGAPDLGVTPLPATATPAFLRCSGFASLDLAPSSPFRFARAGLRALGRGLMALLAEPLHATHVGAGGLTVSFSHIGWAEDNTLAFATDRGGSLDLYTMDSDGAHVSPIATSGVVEVNPKWAPDGLQLAFGRTGTGFPADREVFLIDPDGTGLTQVTNNGVYDQPHDWSPDGDSIALTRETGGVRGVWVMAANGSNAHLVIDSAGSPAYSPDGTLLAVEHELPSGNVEVVVVKTDGTKRANLTDHPAADARPTWSPKGSRLAFVSDRDGNSEIYRMNADGSAQTRLTFDPAVDDDPTWSADGGRIAFRTRRDGNSEIYLITPGGEWPVNITNDPSDDRTPAWIR